MGIHSDYFINHNFEYSKGGLMNFLKRYWFSILLLILFSTFTIIDHKVMKNKIDAVKQDNYQEQIDYINEWISLLRDKQGLVITELYEKRIISWQTDRALQWRDELWMNHQRKKNEKNSKNN